MNYLLLLIKYMSAVIEAEGMSYIDAARTDFDEADRAELEKIEKGIMDIRDAEAQAYRGVGATLSISDATPETFDHAGFEALEYTEIGVDPWNVTHKGGRFVKVHRETGEEVEAVQNHIDMFGDKRLVKDQAEEVAHYVADHMATWPSKAADDIIGLMDTMPWVTPCAATDAGIAAAKLRKDEAEACPDCSGVAYNVRPCPTCGEGPERTKPEACINCNGNGFFMGPCPMCGADTCN